MVLKVQRHWTLLPTAKKREKTEALNIHHRQCLKIQHILFGTILPPHASRQQRPVFNSQPTHLIWASGGVAPHAWQLPRPTEQSVTTTEQPGGGQPVPLATLVAVATAHWRRPTKKEEKRKGDVRDVWMKNFTFVKLLQHYACILISSELTVTSDWLPIKLQPLQITRRGMWGI